MKERTTNQVKNAKDRREAKPDMYAVTRDNVYFVGLDKLDPADQERIKQIISSEYITLERELNRINSIKVHFKQYNKGGRTKYSVHLTIDAHAKPIIVDHVYEPVQWDAVATMHLLMKKARQEILHTFKTNTSWRKSYQKGIL